jgi:formamidopyrimidine-DNA glycosylase
VPELPEVETVTRSIAPLVGRRIVTAEFRCLRVLRGGDPDEMAARLAGRKIAGVKRYGKFILMSIRGGGYLTIHLGMTGKLLLGGAAGKHTHAVLTIDRGVLLYDDSRQFGRLQYSEDFPARIGKLGPEPLEVAFEDFAAAMKRRKTRI